MLRDDRILPITRIPLTFLAILSSIFGPMLFLLPNNTDTLFAWTITPAMSAVFVGASYTFGALVIWVTLWRGKWHPLSLALTGTWAFSAAMLASTILHFDRFHHGTILFYGWFAVYIFTPILLPIAYWLNRRYDPGVQPGEALVPQSLRIVMAIVGGLLVALGLAMFLAPAAFATVWPWRLTPLMARVFGGWFLLPGTAGITALMEPRWSTYRPVLPVVVVWQVLLLIGSLMHLADFDFTRPSAMLWFAMLVGGILLTIGLYVYQERLSVQSRANHNTRVTTPGG
jgi:hypothetical protein